jgi:hypothetical protein
LRYGFKGDDLMRRKQIFLFITLLVLSAFAGRIGRSAAGDNPESFAANQSESRLQEVGVNDFRISFFSGANYNAFRPAVAYNSVDNQYLVVWYGDNNVGNLVDDEYEIWGQALDAATGAAIGIGNNFRISFMGPDGNTAHYGWWPDVAYNSQNNEYLVVWNGLLNGEFEVWSQRLNAATLAPIGGHVRLSFMGPAGSTNYSAYWPKVTYNSVNNQYLVVWSGDHHTGGLVAGELEVFGQRIEGGTGNMIGGKFRISFMGPNGNPDYDAYWPDVTYNSDRNEYLVVWSGDHHTGGLVNEEFEIFGQRLNGTNGVAIGTNFPISGMGPTGDPNYDAYTPAVAYSSASQRYLVVWSGDHSSGGFVDDEFEIYANLLAVSDDGVTSYGPRRLSTMGGIGNPNFDADNPAVSYNSATNSFLVVWSGDEVFQNFREREIFGVEVDAYGMKIGDQVRLSDVPPVNDPSRGAFFPAVAANSANQEFLVVWQADPFALEDNDYEIFGQRVAVSAGHQVFLPLVIK